ncbi:MAG: hypothetical protein GY773_20010 [Actinomycetia bacterium]|nr:hypothetical protein [Actinomycetes bacterium]
MLGDAGHEHAVGVFVPGFQRRGRGVEAAAEGALVEQGTRHQLMGLHGEIAVGSGV